VGVAVRGRLNASGQPLGAGGRTANDIAIRSQYINTNIFGARAVAVAAVGGGGGGGGGGDGGGDAVAAVTAEGIHSHSHSAATTTRGLLRTAS